MEFKLRIQLNGMILPKSLSSNHQPQMNVSFVNRLIPIWWSETAAVIDEESAKEYSSKVNMNSALTTTRYSIYNSLFRVRK